MRSNLIWLQCFLAMVATATGLSAQSRELPAPADALPAVVRDSVLDAVVDEFALTNYIQSPSTAVHTYLSPYRSVGFADTLAAPAKLRETGTVSGC
jgi:hypothetical protein